MTKSEIDQLGDTLKGFVINKEPITQATLVQLDRFRLSFGAAIQSVLTSLTQAIPLPFTIRPSKSTDSIVAKLIRQPTLRLSQIQDVAGLRFVVPDIVAQNKLASDLLNLFTDKPKLIDRREKPTFGYRAIHLVIRRLDRLVEIQIRTELQQMWAHLSEQLADIAGHDLKYGKGFGAYQNYLENVSLSIAEFESVIQDLLPSKIEPDFYANLFEDFSRAKEILAQANKSSS